MLKALALAASVMALGPAAALAASPPPALPPAPVVDVVVLSPEQAPSATALTNKAPIHARIQTSSVR